MLRKSPATYWKSTRAIRKNNYNSTQVVDGTSGDANIANLFRGKYVSLFNSVESTDDELTELIISWSYYIDMIGCFCMVSVTQHNVYLLIS